jgi:hypothetical protein
VGGPEIQGPPECASTEKRVLAVTPPTRGLAGGPATGSAASRANSITDVFARSPSGASALTPPTPQTLRQPREHLMKRAQT